MSLCYIIVRNPTRTGGVFLYIRHIGKELGNLTNRIKRYVDNETAKYGMTHTQAMIIRYLKNNADRAVFQRDIEKEFDIRRSSVTSVLQLMEKNGFIVRTSDESDARLKQIHLTECGINAGEKTRGILRNMDERLNSCLTDNEKTSLFNVIGKLDLCMTGLEQAEERKDGK